MRRTIELLILVLCLGVLPAAAQSLLPGSLPGWTAGPISALLPAQASATQNTAVASAAAAEYGFVKGEQRTYSMGADSLQITLLQMKDPSGAYGEYSFLRTPDLAHADFTDHSSMSEQHALVLIGDVVLDVHGANLSRHVNDVKTLVAAVAAHAHQGPL